jgi:excisionase family DNA binding protein
MEHPAGASRPEAPAPSNRDWPATTPATTSDKATHMPIRPLQAPSNDRQLVFTSSQAAHYVGVSLATIRRWTDAGHIHCYRTPGGQRRFSRDQLDQFVTSMQNAGEIHEPPAAQVA